MSDGIAQPVRRKPDLPTWELSVVEAHDVSPTMRRVIFTAPNISEMTYRPGQDLVLMLPLQDGATGRRHYTIRWLDRSAGHLAVDFFMHGDTPGPRFARNAKSGELVTARGSRGRTHLREEADWHLLTGDETGLPAILHMLETADPDALIFAFIEVENDGDEQPVNTSARVTVSWLYRQSADGASDLLAGRVKSFDFPNGTGHACLTGQTSSVRSQRHDLLSRGMTREQISSEGYWRPDRVGGHDHVDD